MKEPLTSLPQYTSRIEAAFERFLTMTDEKAVLAAKIADHIPPTAVSLLDVGAGNGLLTGHLAMHHQFSDMTLVEPAPDLSATLPDKFPGADIRQEKIETTELSGAYDVILASYVLPFVDNPLDMIKTLRSRLAPGGKLAIVQYDDQCGYADIVRVGRPMIHPLPDGGRFLEWTDVVAFLEQEGYSHNVEQVVTHIRPESTDALIGIFPFMFDTEKQIPEDIERQMVEYARRFQREDGSFDIDATHRCIIVDSGE